MSFISSDTEMKMSYCIANWRDCLYRMLCFLQKDGWSVFARNLRNLALGLPDRVYKDYKEEIDYLSSVPYTGYDPFPYPVVGEIPNVEAFWDADKKMPYVIHNGNRFYYKRNSAVESAKSEYVYFVAHEGILGSGIRSKSPHSYTDKDFRVEEGDVLVDIGCSDGLFAFDNAEKASRIFLFEVDKSWIATLKNSFKPFEDKTSIVNKFVSARTSSKEITLSDALKEVKDKTFFLKMDIEGGERAVIESSADFLKSHRVKLSCCVYHHQSDAVVIKKMLEDLGFTTRFTEGYMLPDMNGIEFPYFRKGVIYARNF